MDEATLLDKVKRVLLKQYTSTPKISRDGQAVTITFTDFVVDVVPAFNRQGGGYLIPDSIQKRWIESDPKRHVEIWAEANKKHGYRLVPIIKMVKAWNKLAQRALLQSFSLETLTVLTLSNATISDFPSGVRYVFDKVLRTLVRSAIYDPAGYGGNVASYLDSYEKSNQIVGRFETAYQRAVEADELNQRGRPDLAFDKWRMIFGDYFPAYG